MKTSRTSRTSRETSIPSTCRICHSEPPRYHGSHVGQACARAINRYRLLSDLALSELADATLVRQRRIQAAGVGIRAYLALTGSTTEPTAD